MASDRVAEFTGFFSILTCEMRREGRGSGKIRVLWKKTCKEYIMISCFGNGCPWTKLL